MCEATNLERLEVIFDNALALLEMIHAMDAVTLLHLLPQILLTHVHIHTHNNNMIQLHIA